MQRLGNRYGAKARKIWGFPNAKTAIRRFEKCLFWCDWLCIRTIGSNSRNDYLLLPFMASNFSSISPNVALSHTAPVSSNPNMVIELCRLVIWIISKIYLRNFFQSFYLESVRILPYCFQQESSA